MITNNFSNCIDIKYPVTLIHIFHALVQQFGEAIAPSKLETVNESFSDLAGSHIDHTVSFNKSVMSRDSSYLPQKVITKTIPILIIRLI